MPKSKNIIQNLGLDEWIFGITGLAAIAIGVLDFLDWIVLTADQLLQMLLVALGLLMTATIVQAKQQDLGLGGIENSLSKFVGGQFDIKRFTRVEFGVEYMASRMRDANAYIEQASLSPPIPRWHSVMNDFDRVVSEVALCNKVKIRYIANFSDKKRMERVRMILANPEINTYFVASFAPDDIPIHMMNFMIVDGEEIIFGVPGFGERDAIIGIKNKEFVSAFESYFNLLWASATQFDRSTVFESQSHTQSAS